MSQPCYWMHLGRFCVGYYRQHQAQRIRARLKMAFSPSSTVRQTYQLIMPRGRKIMPARRTGVSRFLQLPVEIRNKVYEYCFTEVVVSPKCTYDENPAEYPLNLLQVNKQIYMEAATMSYHRCKFDLGWALRFWQPPRQGTRLHRLLNNVRSIDLDWTLEHGVTAWTIGYPGFVRHLQSLASLEEVAILMPVIQISCQWFRHSRFSPNFKFAAIPVLLLLLHRVLLGTRSVPPQLILPSTASPLELSLSQRCWFSPREIRALRRSGQPDFKLRLRIQVMRTHVLCTCNDRNAQYFGIILCLEGQYDLRDLMREIWSTNTAP